MKVTEAMDEKGSKGNMLEKRYTASLGGLLSFLLYIYIVLDPCVYVHVRQLVRSYNVFIYALGLFVFFGAYAVIYKNDKIVAKLWQGVGDLRKVIEKHWLSILIVACIVIGFMVVFDNMRGIDKSWAFFHYSKHIIFLVIAVFAVLALWIDGKEFSWKEHLVKAVSVLAVIFSLVMTVIGLNYYAEDLTENTIYNNDATFSEIYNLYYGEPFSMTQFGIYGRYAIFYVPLLNLCGGLSVSNVMLIHTLTACLTVLCFVYFIVKTVKNHVVRCSFLLCMSFFWGSMTVVTYQAVVRFFPGAMMFFWWAFNYGKPLDNKRILFGYLLGALGIVWNLEFGLVASLSWAVYVNWVLFFREGKQDIACMIFAGAKVFGGVMAAFFLGWFLAGAFNMVCYHGEFLSFRNMTIPHTNSAYMVNSLQSFLLERGQLPWLVVIGTALLSIGIFGEQQGKEAGRNGAIVFAAVAVLGGLVYYINRFHFGCIFYIYFPSIALLSLLFDRILEACTTQGEEMGGGGREFFFGVRGGIFFLVGAFTVCVLINVGYVNTHRQQVYGMMEEARRGQMLLDTMREKVPKDTPAAGPGMTEIYNRLGWDTMYHYTDAFYQTKEGVAAYEELLLDGKSKVICMHNVRSYVESGLMISDPYERIDSLYDKVYLGSIVISDYWYLVKK